MKQRYFIAHIIKGDAGEYLSGLARNIAVTFGVRDRTKSPPHITFKGPFDADTRLASEVKHVLHEFARARKSAPVLLAGFGHFLDEVVFADVAPSSDASSIATELVRALQNVSGLSFGAFDFQKKLHATLAKNITENFQEIWCALSVKQPPDFCVLLDSIALLRKEGNEWKIDKEYTLA